MFHLNICLTAGTTWPVIQVPLRMAAGSCGASQPGGLVIGYHILVRMFHLNIRYEENGIHGREGWISTCGHFSKGHMV